ncbi:ABC transporter ATP-binding protein [Streptococcus varani]
MKEKIIEFVDFSFKYQAQQEPTLKNINLSIQKGEKVLIIGPSGSGKSTLGHCLNGIIPNTFKGEKTGIFTINGKDAFDLSIYEKSLQVSTVLQDTDGQFIGLTVAEDLAFALENDVLDLASMRKRVSNWSHRLELDNLLTNRPQDLSGGQKQRVSLAGVLIDESPILLFDEPLANLDPKSGQDTIDLIDRLHREEGATTIIIEHRLEDVLYRAVDKVVLINDGKVLYDGSPDDLLAGSLLIENGIREPLYIMSLRELGFDLTQMTQLSHLENIDFRGFHPILPNFQDSSKKTFTPLMQLKYDQFAYETGKNILENIHLDIKKGERLAIVGKNGAGKSTLAKLICHFLEGEGKESYQGVDISGDSVAKRASRVGYVLQNPNQMISQSLIFDEVALGLRLRGVAAEEVEKRVHATLKTCGLYAFRKWPVSALSYGQKKRLTIASVLVLGPEMILLDEPTAGQDQRHYNEIMTFLDELANKGHSIVMITHDMQLMLEHSDRTVVVADGKIIADDSPIAILSQDQILKKANLKQTSLFTLAQHLKLEANTLSQFYIVRRLEVL